MADISLSSRADVRPLPGAQCRRFTAAGVILAGYPVYLNSSGQPLAADADDAEKTKAIGVVVSDNDGGTAFGTNDIVDVCVHGALTGFTSLNEGTLHFTSANAGSISDTSPGSGNYKWALGIAHSTTIIFINPFTDDLAQLTS